MYNYIVVDDEAIIRQGLIKKIDKLGMDLDCVGQAANGLEGLKLIEQANPDIVITDMKMPEMDGTGFLDHISAQYPDKKVIVLSSYQDFEYMNTAIETGVVGYVLKPFSAEEIQKQLKKAIDRIEQQKDIKAQVGIMKEHIGVFEKRMSNRKLLNFIIHPAEVEITENIELEKYKEAKELMLITVKTTNPALLPELEILCKDEQHGINALPLEDASQKYCYFILLLDFNGHDRILEGYASELAGKLKTINRDFAQYICISNTCNDIMDVNNLYKSCVDSFWGVRLSERQVILKPQKRTVKRVHTDEQIRDIFVGMRYSPDMINELLESFFSELEKEDVSFEVLYAECRSLINLINEYATEYNIEIENIMDIFYDRYSLETKTDRIKREFSGYIMLIFKSVKDSSQSQECLMENIKNYIDNNYGSKITLEFISSKFFINPSYCSNLFKLKAHESFNEYLTRIRMGKAMKFLSETKMSIDNVSKEVGYRNPKYFFKIFKKYNGLTPTEYRNRKLR